MASRDKRIGQNIAQFRGEMSQKEIAERMTSRGWKWSQATVWSVESGKRPLRYAEAVDVCWILGYELSALEGDEEDLKVQFFVGKYFQAIDTVRDALTKATDWHLSLARNADSTASQLSSDKIVVAIRDDNVLDAFARMFCNIARAKDSELRQGGKSYGTATDALLDEWLAQVQRVEGRSGEHQEAP